MIAVALRGVRLDAGLVTAVTFGRALIPKLRLAFIRAVFGASGRLAVTVFVTTFHCGISIFQCRLEAHRHHNVAELAVRWRAKEAGTRLI